MINYNKQQLYFLVDFKQIVLADCKPYVAYLLAIVVALLVGTYLFTLPFLLGHGAFFEFEQGDPAQNVSGWLFYVRDQWHFPLGYTQRLNYPTGANIALTDSIPLAAFVFKLLRHWLPADFQYFGLWRLFTYLLQSIAGVMLIRALGYRSWLAAFAGAVFSILMPCLLARRWHTALTTQGLILLAFTAYISGIKQSWSLLRTFSFFMGVIIAALLIHPYFFAMIYPIFIAFLIDYSYQNQNLKPFFRYGILSVLLVLLIFFTWGYFGFGGIGGFGNYSMNLTAPFCGGLLSPACQVQPGRVGRGLIIWERGQ